MKNFIKIVKQTDKRVFIGMALMCAGQITFGLGSHRDGINDTVRAIEDEIAKQKEEEKN